jgi:hypothetical protein
MKGSIRPRGDGKRRGLSLQSWFFPNGFSHTHCVNAGVMYIVRSC